jgi:hypothetical protein
MVPGRPGKAAWIGPASKLMSAVSINSAARADFPEHPDVPPGSLNEAHVQ